jgi:hypothetical protein
MFEVPRNQRHSSTFYYELFFKQQFQIDLLTVYQTGIQIPIHEYLYSRF